MPTDLEDLDSLVCQMGDRGTSEYAPRTTRPWIGRLTVREQGSKVSDEYWHPDALKPGQYVTLCWIVMLGHPRACDSAQLVHFYCS